MDRCWPCKFENLSADHQNSTGRWEAEAGRSLETHGSSSVARGEAVKTACLKDLYLRLSSAHTHVHTRECTRSTHTQIHTYMGASSQAP